MAQNTAYSMNDELRRGVADGSVRFARPNARSNRDAERHVRERGGSPLFGNLGVSSANPGYYAEVTTNGAVEAQHPRRLNRQEVLRSNVSTGIPFG